MRLSTQNRLRASGSLFVSEQKAQTKIYGAAWSSRMPILQFQRLRVLWRNRYVRNRT